MTESNGDRPTGHHPSAAWHQDAVVPRAKRSRDGQPDPQQERRRAISDLGDELRNLVDLAAATEVSAEDLDRAAVHVRAAAALLATERRHRPATPRADDFLDGIRMHNPVTGAGSAFAPPLQIVQEGGLTVGTCTLGLAFEGPPSYVHGGVSAMLLDQMLGYAVSASGHPGMTVRLDTVYRTPVPLETPLRLTAEVTAIDGRKVTATGTVATAAAPDTLLVTATGTFVALRADQARRLFGAVSGITE
ncbi:PaaI family thioesterase [Actinoplanes sp. NPDC051859]|uniref:PaaI family thioesterase n=1 Tax=Actinoplanes sp. NPDC051859 TaxID=3363909 RepID=UPI0037A854B9